MLLEDDPGDYTHFWTFEDGTVIAWYKSQFLAVPTAIPSIAPRYFVKLIDTTGYMVALFDSWISLEYGSIVDDVGYYSLSLDGNDDRLDLFQLDYMVEVWRGIPGVGVDWYCDFRGLHRTPKRAIDSKGKKIFTSTGVCLNHLLSRRDIGYKAGTIRADKDDVAETVMKEYVAENCGVDATVANGRLRDGAFPGFTIDADGGQGINWPGSRAYENLLGTLMDIANVSGIDYRVESLGNGQYRFFTYVDQLGVDRSVLGLNPATGLNAAGYPPVIFSVPIGNVQNIDYELNRNAEANAVFLLGKGDGSTRHITIVEDPGAGADSPWNDIEVAVNASSQEYEFQRVMVGIETLQQKAARESFSFTPLQQASSLYGVHYGIGDKVTAKYDDIQRDKRIVAVKVAISSSKETVDIVFADIPRRR